MTVVGMDRFTGKGLDATAHIAQCVNDILMTPIGTMPWLRNYGSLLYALIDQPGNAAIAALIRAAAVTAIQRWEPRIRVNRLSYAPPSAGGTATLTIEAQRIDAVTPEALSLTIPLS